MPVNRTLWEEHLTKVHVPNWHCPSCDGGYLKYHPKSLQYIETRDSLKAHDHEAWEPEWIEFTFAAILVCNNEECREPVSVTGLGHVEIVQTAQNGDSNYVEFFSPQHVAPSPPLIVIPKRCPQPVADALRHSFVSFWGDCSASGNHIRTAVERLLDHLKVPKSALNKKGKRERLSLHSRIVKLASRDKPMSEALLAVKWIGNVGTHTDGLSRKDIFDAFDIVESILENLFVRNRDRLTKLVVAINKNKGPSRKRVP